MKKCSLPALLIFVFIASVCEAIDVQPAQVQIESKIVYVTQKDRDVGIDMAFVITPMPDGHTTQVDVSTLAYGQGANFRKWVPENPQIRVEEPKRTVLPDATSKIYIAKSSIAAPIAPLLFGAIGTQYEPYADRAASSPGTPCSVGGSHTSTERGDVAEAIDKTGMAVGLGLLASQAKGQIEGQRSTFFLKDIPVLGTQFRTEVRNKSKNELVVFITPIIVNPGE